MKEYPKIESLYDRDEKTHRFIPGKWRLPVFQYLYHNDWLWTEKIDGTNVRIMWDGETVRFGGRTDNAQMPTFLLSRLQDMVTAEAMAKVFDGPACLYGEGYGAKIQKAGTLYKPDGVDFALFDVRVGDWWLEWGNVEGIAEALGLRTVPIIDTGTIDRAEKGVSTGFYSVVGDLRAEGLVGRPVVDLRMRNGDRVIVKLKTRDF